MIFGIASSRTAFDGQTAHEKQTSLRNAASSGVGRLSRPRFHSDSPPGTGVPFRGQNFPSPCEGDVAMPALASQEIVTVVDGENRPVAELPRHRVRSENLAHRATYIFVFDRRGRVLVQRRTATKDMYPSHYDLAAGGVVAAGESYEECAKREAEEELGIRGAALERRLDFYYEDERNRCFGRVFSCVREGPFTLQAEEVESVEFLTADEIAAGRAAPVTPDSLMAFHRLVEREGAAERPENGLPDRE